MTTRRITSSSITSGGGGATVRYQPEQPVGITPGELWVDSDGDTDVVDAETFLTKESASASYVYKTGDTITGPTVITANSSSDILRITQTGSGNALVVEDSTNPDSAPFLIDNSGNVGISAGTGTPEHRLDIASTNANVLGITRYANNTGRSVLYLRKSRGTSIGSNTIVNSGDGIGALIFQGANGTGFSSIAEVSVEVDGTPGPSGDMPGRLIFSTTPDGSASVTERMRITSSGNVGIGTVAPSAILDIRDETNGANFIVGGSGTTNLTKIGGGAADALGLYTNSSVEVMRLSTSGNVGIGADTPQSNLQINTDTQISLSDGTNSSRSDGTIRLTLTSGGTQGDGQLGTGISFGRINSGRRGALISSVQTTSDADQTGLLFAVRAGTTTSNDTLAEAARITHAGAVLIGTQSPGSAGAGDLVVDGGVFLGGSAAANELDDYEEGTFTLSTLTVQSGPTPGAGASYSGTYTKIGNVVTCFVNIQFDDSGTSVAVDDRFYFSSGLPFAEANTEFPSVGTFLIRAALSSGVAALGQVIVGNSNLWFYVTHVDGSPDYGDEFNGQFTYITNS